MLLMQDRENKVWYQYKNFYVSLNNSSFKMICQYFFPVLQDLVFAAVSVFLGFLHFSGIFAGGSNFIYFINQTVKTIHLFILVLCISRGTNFRGRIKKKQNPLKVPVKLFKKQQNTLTGPANCKKTTRHHAHLLLCAKSRKTNDAESRKWPKTSV